MKQRDLGKRWLQQASLLWSVIAGCSSGGGATSAALPAASAGQPAAPATQQTAGPTPPDCSDADPGLPANVFCAGVYVGTDTTQHPPDVLAYNPGVKLWSDGAEKQRYLYLPPNTQIDTSNMDSWKFPVGTKIFKEFRLDGKLVETRELRKIEGDKWLTGTYVWDADGKQATLNESRRPLLLANGYEIPTARDCGKCHHGGADYALGVEAVALALPGADGETLTKLVADGKLSDPPGSTTIELPEDETGKAGAALGYLHANCGMPCHSTRGLGDETMLVLRLRADEFWTQPGAPATAVSAASTDTYAATVGQAPTTKSVIHKFPSTLRITPGDHNQSLVWLLAHTRGDYQMPPLVSHKIDDVGTELLSAWIDALPSTAK